MAAQTWSPRAATAGDGLAVWSILWARREDIGFDPKDVDATRAWIVELCSKGECWVVAPTGPVEAAMIFDGMEIRYLAVAPGCDGRRYGSALIRVALDSAEEGCVRAEVRPTNGRTRALLERHGFQYVETVHRTFAWDKFEWEPT